MHIKTLSLRPTQFALGLKEVEAKVEKVKKMSSHELEAYLNDHAIPVIKHENEFHLIDHHHLVRVAWEAQIEKVPVKIIEDLSHHSHQTFWKVMQDKSWVHLFDQFGKGPHQPDALPLDIRGLADDIYRSLAWGVREAGAYEKNETPFSEFKWADFFRNKISIDRKENAFELALKEAIKLARSEAAAHLPGFSFNPTSKPIKPPTGKA